MDQTPPILQSLKSLEQEKNIRILFACESGSRAWGFPSPDSDYDVRFIYCHEKDFYLSLIKKRDVIQLPIDETLDISGWDLKKTLLLLKKANAPIFEYIQSPIIYAANPAFLEGLTQAANLFYDRFAVFYHYHSLVKKFIKEWEVGQEVKLKKLMYALRSSLAAKWVVEQNTMPPMEFHFLLKQIQQETELCDNIANLLDLKSRNIESFTMPLAPALLHFIKKVQQYNNTDFINFTPRRKDMQTLDALFRETLQSA